MTMAILRYGVLVAILGMGLLALAGCSFQDLRRNEGREITAWGVWAVVMGAPIGIGYFHSKRGPDINFEESAKPGIPK